MKTVKDYIRTIPDFPTKVYCFAMSLPCLQIPVGSALPLTKCWNLMSGKKLIPLWG